VLAYFQVLHAFSQLPSVRWPARFAAFLERLSLFSFQLFSANPLSCVLDVDVSFVHQLLCTLLLPIIGAALVLLLALLVAQCTLPKGERGLRAVAVRPETCTLQLSLLLLLYPSLAKTALTPFDRVTLGDARLLRANAAVPCDDDEWRMLARSEPPARSSTRSASRCSASSPRAPRAAPRSPPPPPPRLRPPPRPPQLRPLPGWATATTGGGWAGRRRDRHRRRLLLSRAAAAYHLAFWYRELLEVLRTSVVLVVAQNTLLQVYLGLLVCIVASTSAAAGSSEHTPAPPMAQSGTVVALACRAGPPAASSTCPSSELR